MGLLEGVSRDDIDLYGIIPRSEENENEFIPDIFCSLNKAQIHFTASIPVIQTRIRDDSPELLAAGWMLKDCR